ncbi:MAG: hypothetical protein D5R99_08100 [Methanocalculus sp. MSAO_Arc1]|nr:MAG: hypothetical protein D5R99_08100 [Methanocalculus sp. MSAO_Arc1]
MGMIVLSPHSVGAEGPADQHTFLDPGKSLNLWNRTNFKPHCFHCLNQGIATEETITMHLSGISRYEPALHASEKPISTESAVYLLREIACTLPLVSTDESRRFLKRRTRHLSVWLQNAREALSDNDMETFIP